MDLCEKMEDFGDFKVIRNVISDEEIQSLMNFWNSFDSFIDVDKNLWNNKLPSITRIRASNRIVDIVGIQKNDLPFVTNIFTECFSCVISEFVLEFPHYFARYPLSGKHTKHKDFNPSFPREWLMSLILNDNFESGDLIINGKIAPKEKGIAILFKSDLFHEVTPTSFVERFVVTECADKI